MPADAYVNRIATAVPDHEVHRFFLDFAASLLAADPRRQEIFGRMVEKAGIEKRYSCFAPTDDPQSGALDRDGIFRRDAFPGTGQRMEMFDRVAPELAAKAVGRLLPETERSAVTHLIVATCTGFSAPGIDIELVTRCGLPTSVERTIIGFMGCYAAINALKLARHIVRSEPEARVLVVNVEICTLHLKETHDLEKLLSFCLWGDGCAAALVTCEPHGLRLDGFHAALAPDRRDLMSWHIHDDGFDMFLSGKVPAALQEILGNGIGQILRDRSVAEIGLWAIHPGGRSVLDAAERALGLGPHELEDSREVLRANGNMSSATIMFVLERMLATAAPGILGCAMAFGPGLATETMIFGTA
jgi:predicted naringenin-chalcone synthase